jgi:hypothetical protein
VHGIIGVAEIQELANLWRKREWWACVHQPSICTLEHETWWEL